MKTFNTKDSCTGNMTHNTESAAGRNMKPMRWV